MDAMIRRLLLSTLILAAPLAAPVAAAPAADRVSAVLRAHAPAQSHIGVSVVSLATGQTVFAHEADKLFTPASLQKLVTASAAVSILGATRRFATRLMTEGLVENGTLRGHLYLKGEGDPVLEAADLEALASSLRAQGIRKIAGDLVTDDSLFAPEGRGAAGWAWDDLAWGYGAPVSALSVHRNTLDVTVAPGSRPGDLLHFALTPETGYVQLQNRARTAKAGTEADVEVEGGNAGMADRWLLTGQLAANSAQVTISRSIESPALFAGTVLKEALARKGVTLEGRIYAGKAPASARSVAIHQSPPLADLVREMNKESDNMIAETLLLHIGVRGQGAPGTWEKGLGTTLGFLERQGWKAGQFRMEDGSGLSRYNAVTPAQLTGLLTRLPADRLTYPALLISLPVSGVDGTLASRLGDEATRGRVRAKTGTMSGVSGLAGYLTGASGETLAVAIMINGFIGSAAEARALQDKVIGALAE